MSAEDWVLFDEADVVASAGATWEDGILVLEGGEANYAILGIELPFCSDVQLSLTGQADGAWLGVGDYRGMRWDWRAGQINAPQVVHLPVERCFNAWASVYIVVYCPASCTARLLICVLGEWGTIAPPPGLIDPVVPADMAEDYAWVEQYLAEGGQPYGISTGGTPGQQRALGFRMFATYDNLAYDKLTICTVINDQETNDRLMALVLRQCDGRLSTTLHPLNRYYNTIQFNHELTRGQLAWYGDWLRTHLYETVYLVQPVVISNIPPP